MTGHAEPFLTVSNSSIQTFKQCKRKWWLSSYRRLRPREREYTGALSLGSNVHTALEMRYSYGIASDEAWRRITAHFRDIMLKEGRDLTDFDSEAELGRIMLEGYENWVRDEGVDSDLDFVSAEEIVSAALTVLDEPVNLVGKIDARYRRKSDGVRLGMDIKTAANLAEVARDANMSQQFKTYTLLETLKEGEENRVDGFLIRILKKVKRTANARPPFYDQVEIRHNIFTLRTFWQQVHGVIADMVQTKRALDAGADPHYVAYPTPTRNCSWQCEFFAICPLFDDGSAAEKALDAAYQKGDPFDYYKENLAEELSKQQPSQTTTRSDA